MTIADFVATIPACKDLIPGKDEFHLYCDRYANPDYSLQSMLMQYNCEGLSKAEIEAVAKKYGNRGLWGTLEEIVQKTRIYIGFSIQEDLPLLEWHMRNDTDEAEKRKNYEKLRAFVGKTIGQFIRYEYCKMKFNGKTEQEIASERQAAEREADKERNWREAREKVIPLIEKDPNFFSHINRYQLSEFEKKVAIRYSCPLMDGWTREYHLPIPVQSLKMRTIREIWDLNIREFAKKIGYKNVNKYSSVIENGVENNAYIDITKVFDWKFIWKVCKATGVNPYWLGSLDEVTILGFEESDTAHSIEDALGDYTRDMPLYADNEIIRHWALEQHFCSQDGQEAIKGMIDRVGEDKANQFIVTINEIWGAS